MQLHLELSHISKGEGASVLGANSLMRGGKMELFHTKAEDQEGISNLLYQFS